MTLSVDNQQKLQYTAALTRFYHWLENQTNFKRSKNINSTVQLINQQKTAGHLPSFSECMNFCNRQEYI